MTISLRPHHVLCSIGFEGKGYGDAFVANMAHIVNGQLRGVHGRDVRVVFTGTADSICAPCPKRVGLGCEKQAQIDALDAAHAEILDIAPRQSMTWGACLERVCARVRPDDLDRICAGCSWLEQGMCKRALASLLDHEKRRTPRDAASV